MAEHAGRSMPFGARIPLTRSRPTFQSRTATDTAAQLLRRSSLPTSLPKEVERSASVGHSRGGDNINVETAGDGGHPWQQDEALSPHHDDDIAHKPIGSFEPGQRYGTLDETLQNHHASPQRNDKPEKPSRPKVGSFPRPVGGTEKLGTFSGVFVPTSLNVLSILMFIRFGFILGQSGLLGMLGMLIAAYLINLLTTMSISAVASNGTVRGGGAYYLISRSLGPEFGGSIGLISYLGLVFNTGMNAVGLIDCLNYVFGSRSGNWSKFIPEGGWWQYLFSTLVVVACVGVCLAGSSIFARASNGLLLVLLLATLSIPLSSLVLRPFESVEQYTKFTGISFQTLKKNLLPHFTHHAAGSQIEGRETFQDLFGILFPATGGIFAGASMSGDLKSPSKSIPSGTLYGLLLTFILYTLVILGLAASVTRESFYQNVNIVQDTNISGVLVLLGEVASTVFSVLMGIIGPAKQLQAIARDRVFPGLSIFGQGTKKNDEPIFAILITFVVAQITILFDINRIASFVTMSYLMSFFSVNAACFLLRLTSAPNFRPSFHYFNIWTAFLGAVLSIASMFFVDGFAASGAIACLILIFLVIHYTTPPKPWGDVSSGLIYHQVRKYLLRLRAEHVKFWHPSILLFCNDPRRQYRLIQFCNSLKKGGLFILGHVIVTQNFGASVPEARKQQAAWTKYIDFSKIKAFVNVAISPALEWGARNIVLSAGLGGMRPNIVVFGFFNMVQFRNEQPLIDIPSPPPECVSSNTLRRRRRSLSQIKGSLPTDECYVEKRTDIQSYVMVLEDMILKVQINVAIGVGFSNLELPGIDSTKRYIDLWPIQMSAEIPSQDPDPGRNYTTTNFDTYTLILQLGCILNTVPSWKRSHKLRVAVFVEYESDVEEERARVTSLLENLRIQAEVVVFWLACGSIQSYEMIVNGNDVDAATQEHVEKILEDEQWWEELQRVRGKVKTGELSTTDALSMVDEVQWGTPVFGRRDPSVARFDGLRRILRQPRRHSSFGNLSTFGISLSMRAQRLDDDLLSRHVSHPSDSDLSDTDTEEHTEDFEDDVESEEHDSQAAGSANQDHFFAQDDEPSPERNDSKIKSKNSSKKSSRASSRKSKQSGHIKEERNTHRKGGDENKPLVDYGQTREDHEEQRGRSGRPPAPSSDKANSTASKVSAQSISLIATHLRNKSPNFSSSPVPVTQVADGEDVGPSIMFADEPHPRRQRKDESRHDGGSKSIYQRGSDNIASDTHSISSSGFPSAGAIPLSFNALPSRSQHAILNELIAQNSENTAVILTTLPAPAEGTYKSEAEALKYISDLECLTSGLPPTLLVHSNSMTVTMNL